MVCTRAVRSASLSVQFAVLGPSLHVALPARPGLPFRGRGHSSFVAEVGPRLAEKRPAMARPLSITWPGHGPCGRMGLSWCSTGFGAPLGYQCQPLQHLFQYQYQLRRRTWENVSEQGKSSQHLLTISTVGSLSCWRKAIRPPQARRGLVWPLDCPLSYHLSLPTTRQGGPRARGTSLWHCSGLASTWSVADAQTREQLRIGPAVQAVRN